MTQLGYFPWASPVTYYNESQLWHLDCRCLAWLAIPSGVNPRTVLAEISLRRVETHHRESYLILTTQANRLCHSKASAQYENQNHTKRTTRQLAIKYNCSKTQITVSTTEHDCIFDFPTEIIVTFLVQLGFIVCVTCDFKFEEVWRKKKKSNELWRYEN